MTRGRDRTGTRILAWAACLTALALLAVPRAEAAQLYWTNHALGAGEPGTVGRANLDGSGATNSFISAPGISCGVAADLNHVYWAAGEAAPGQIGRSDPFGGAIDNAFITPTNSFNCGVAVNADSIFFNNHAIPSIGRANLDGGGVEQTFVLTGGNNTQHPAVNSTHLFWTNKNSNTVGRATLAGGNIESTLLSAKCELNGVAVNDQYVYWANDSCASIGRAKLTPGGVTDIEQDFIPLSVGKGPCGLAVDANHIYWGQWGDDAGGTVGRANLDGTGVDEALVTTTGPTCSVAVGPDPVQLGAGGSTTPTAKPAGFKFKPPVRCSKGCKRILVSFEFDAAGTVVAQQAMPRKKGKGKGKAKGRSKARASARGKARRKGVAKLVKRLSQPVNAGLVTLKLKPTAAGKAALARKGKLKVKVAFSYTPSGGAASTAVHRLTAKPPRVKSAKPKGAKHAS